MVKVTVKQNVNRLTARVEELASDYKYRGLSRYEAWNEFIKDRALKPDVNAKEFYTVFDQSYGVPLNRLTEVDFLPTHFDELKGLYCQIVQELGGVFRLLWENGDTGSNPPSYPPEASRFKQVNTNVQKGGQ